MIACNRIIVFGIFSGFVGHWISNKQTVSIMQQKQSIKKLFKKYRFFVVTLIMNMNCKTTLGLGTQRAEEPRMYKI